mmetsp:Transcript_3156/g.8545  ORF Transcript_3156/g.8545 Transcript_3156/m.8545 type:complete len:419 (-) Transcript_3156:28-1284(-)|eukprot:CAMPEP_0119130240 /NCGR_PEP_ID=MMETSP1310-20130426/7656_1 /TAXON_ID=464262 /ORGANISM="Genus nov. species nov., Strain RCC2339" /LENGTH=418 /DNA_ID=CAMNT_0007120731 /DNA_START=99 /DNA_END=1355 /DNA_ORIENTATION=+
MAAAKEKVLLAYSGGLDTSTILLWLMEKGYEVLAFIANVGQREDFEAVEKKALKIGATKFFCEDLCEEFVTEFIFDGIRANAVYDGRYLMGTSYARPCISRKLVEVARREGCKYISHGATGKGNDAVRFELSCYACDPDIQVIAPWREPEFLERFKGRPDLLEYAKKNGIEVSATPSSPYSEDENLFHISHESGILEDPATECPESVYNMVKSPMEAAEKPEIIDVHFKDGVPVKVVNKTDGTEKVGALALFLYLNELGSKHGIGRLDMVENRFIGVKSRGIYENPGAFILRECHMDIEGIAMDREVLRLRDMLAVRFSELVYNGFWFSPEMDFIRAALYQSQEAIDGRVTARLYRGTVFPLSRESPSSLYDKDLVSFDIEGGFCPPDQGGFIRINAIRLKAHHHIMKKRNAENAAQK